MQDHTRKGASKVHLMEKYNLTNHLVFRPKVVVAG